MAVKPTTLRNFKEEELLFDEAETRAILKFFFYGLREIIDAATITEDLRNFAQGLLIEAIDATYALGYIQILISSHPGNSMQKVLSKLARKSISHWFKHARPHDLISAKISLAVRKTLARSFLSIVIMLLDGVANTTPAKRPHFAFVQHDAPLKTDLLIG